MNDNRDAFFLNVEHSSSQKAWRDRLDIAAQRSAQAMTQQIGISDILARILAGRGVELDGVEEFLLPTIRDLMPDPSCMTDMDSMAERLADAIQKEKKIALFGDYDVDGASSVALMVRYLRFFGTEPLWHIPDRIFEGYGPNIGAIDKLIEGGAEMLITLDCGSTSHEALTHAAVKGCEVLVLDHHQMDELMPAADALVNPNRPDDISGLGNLCAAGVTFMALVAVSRVLRGRGVTTLPDLMGFADLVALATICDVVPLTGLNRAFVSRGVELMRKGLNPGIASLALAARVSGPLMPYHLGFVIGPRINAGGRIGDAGLGARLLSTQAEDEAMAIAAHLDELNSERQRIEIEAVEEAIGVAEAEIGSGEGPAVLVLASEHWHAGVVGLVAARLKERFNRPAFAIALRPDGTGTGSGRSVSGVDLGQAVIGAVEMGLITKGGGHQMAAGITLAFDQIAKFRAQMNLALGEDVAKARDKSHIFIDAAITARAASVAFIEDFNRAGPFGAGNANPIFALAGHKVKFADIVGKGGHVRCTLASGDGASLKAIAFRAAQSEVGQLLLNAPKDRPLHICGTLGINHWQGRETAQMRIIDAADPARSSW